MGRLLLGEVATPTSWRRLEDVLGQLDSRKEPRSFTVSVDFGSTPATSAVAEVTGLTWITTSHHVTFSLRSAADLTAGLTVAAHSVVAGKGFTLEARSSSALTGVHTLSCIAV